MKKFWGPYMLTPQGLSDDIITCIERNDVIEKYFVEFNGNICFRVKDEFIYHMLLSRLLKNHDGSDKDSFGRPQQFMRVIEDELKAMDGKAREKQEAKKGDLSSTAKNIDRANLFKEENNTEGEELGILFPFGEVFQKMYLNSLRGFNNCETFARMQEYIGGKNVRRFSCLQNSGYFHGVLLNYLAKKFDKSSAPIDSLNIEHVVDYLQSNGITTEKQIKLSGREGLESINKEDLKALWEKINESALKDLLASLSRFCGLNQKDIEIYESASVSKNAKNVFKNLQQRGVLEYHQNKGYCVNLKNKIVIMDDLGFLTKEGLFLAFCNEISEKYPNIRELLVSTDIQDEPFYDNIQEMIASFGWKIFPKIRFAGHNDLLTQEKNLIYLENYLRTISTELGNNLRKVYPTLPEHLTPEQEAAILSLLLGWVRFWDHTKGRRNSYVLNSGEVIDFIIKKDELVNLRMKVREIVDGLHKSNMNGVKNPNRQMSQEQRILALQLLQFDEIVEESLAEKKIEYLVQYLNFITNIIIEMIKRGVFKNSQSTHLNTVLAETAFEVISNSFYLLGVSNKKA